MRPRTHNGETHTNDEATTAFTNNAAPPIIADNDEATTASNLSARSPLILQTYQTPDKPNKPRQPPKPQSNAADGGGNTYNNQQQQLGNTTTSIGEDLPRGSKTISAYCNH